ncbi:MULTISPECIES: hypothetical protein [unclassified Streptomyces]|uniref:hypothetical protein n=1 Tax=unclassified Streptomyces TaxID=2593676 RepID=UPI00224E9721|nr:MULTISPECIES: hypothetical protein [unclassified Streptomyces]MCX4527422.1 hypothetical protein [Streptomyces sp. NBC_01551]MCX4541997.1 hypothetical protein [Streptomyces sp. NBC_01565]
MRKFARRAGAVVAAVAVVGAGLAGCTSGEPEPKDAGPTVPASPPPVVKRTPTPSAAPATPAGTEEFGPAVAQQGDVRAYAPVRDGDTRLRVPVVITNTETRQGFYEVTVRVTGPDGYEASGGFATDTVGVYHGASWPTEVTVEMAGRKPPSPLRVEIAEVKRR